MDIKSKISELLQRDKHSFSDLAQYLQMSEVELASALKDGSLALRQLESISKALRVPFYSLFRAGELNFDVKQKPHQVNRLWTGDDASKDKARLLEEIALLRDIIALKEAQVKKLG